MKSFFLFAGWILSCVSFVNAQGQTFGDTPSFEADQSITWPGEVSGKEEEGTDELPIKGFRQINLDYEYISASNFTNPGFKNQALGFGEGTFALSYTRLFSLEHGLNFGLGYTLTTLWWNPNPFFDQDNFEVLNFSCNGFTKLWKCVEVKGGVSASVDTRHFALDYTYYNITGWGRYIWETRWCGEVGLNFGATARTGLKGEFVYPIVGVDFSPRDDIQVNFVFPIDMVITYKVSEHVAIDLAGKLWNSRRRLGPGEPLSRGYFEYRNAGIEMGAVLDFEPFAAANVHVGTTLGTGDMRVSDSNDQNERILDISPAPYVGGEIWFRF